RLSSLREKQRNDEQSRASPAAPFRGRHKDHPSFLMRERLKRLVTLESVSSRIVRIESRDNRSIKSLAIKVNMRSLNATGPGWLSIPARCFLRKAPRNRTLSVYRQ